MTRKTESSRDQRKFHPSELKPRLLGAEGRISVASRFILALLIAVGGPLSSFSASSASQEPVREPLAEPNIYYPPYAEQAYSPDMGDQYQGEGPEIPDKEGEGVFFEVVADPSVLGPNGELGLTVTIANNTAGAIQGISFVDALETGMQFVEANTDGVVFSARNNSVTFNLDELRKGESASFSYQLLITAKAAANRAEGEIWFHTTRLSVASKNMSLKAEAVFWIGRTQESATTEIDRVPTEGGWVEADVASIYFPADALSEEGVAKITVLPEGRPGPELQFEVEILESPGLTVADGDVTNSQKIEVGDVVEEPLVEEAFLEVDFAPVVDLNEIPAGMEPYVATFDPENDIWVKVPIVEIDYADNTVTVETAHFSVWGAGTGNSFPQNGAGALLFDQPFTSLFTGGARYSIPIWTPPGRAGMAPDIALSYSSKTIDGVIGDVQAPWVGVGWNIDAVEIVRQIDTDENGYGYVNNFALTFNGELHTLQVDPNNPQRYYTERASFLYIERHNLALGNADGVTNASKEWWEVVATDGTRYRLGWDIGSEQMTLMYGYKCQTGNPCTTPDSPYNSLGYAGVATNMVASRWRVDRVMDTHGNFIDYSYTEEQPAAPSGIPPFDRASYINNIDFTGFITGGLNGTVQDEPGYQVHFVLADRSLVGDTAPLDFGIWDQWDSQLLERIQIWCDVCDADGETPGIQETLVRTYDFTYVSEQEPNANGTLTLKTLTVFGGDFTEGSTTIPLTTAATVTFNYENKENRAVSGEDDPWIYPRLSGIDNGYEGSLVYTYEQIERGTNSWHNYRVSEAKVYSDDEPTTGLVLASIQKYVYGAPVYTNEGGTGLGALVGHPTATETSFELDGSEEILDTVHTFGTTGLDTGRELTTEWKNPANGTVLRKTRFTYVTDNSQAPFSGWNFRYLLQQEQFELINTTLSLVNKTVYQRNPANGNLNSQSDYLGGNLYRKQTFEYVQNTDPSVYILDRVSRQVLRDANNVIRGETRNVYDPGLTLGELRYTQSLTGESYPQSVDAGFVYDDYGNMVEARSYTAYGSAGATPAGAFIESLVEYDETLNTFPVESTNALGQSSTSEYLFTMGAPLSVTDPNGWESNTAYDGVGRVVATWAPGFSNPSQPNVAFVYPTPVNGEVTAPYSLRMDILDTLGPTSPTYRSVWGIYDGLSRMLQQQVWDADSSQFLLSETAYNAQGLANQQSLPHFGSATGGVYSAPDWEELSYSSSEYDLFGRITEITQPGSITSSSSYSGLSTTVIDPNGHQVTRTADGLGRMLSVKEFSGEYPTTQLYATTYYSYDLANRLTQVQDDHGNFTFIEYDWLGRKTSMDDPDMGLWSYEYNPVGTLAQQTDARGQDLGFTYDELGRLIEKEDLDAELTLATYTYGTAAGEVGFRVGMSDQVGDGTTWEYSNYGRTVSENRDVDGVGIFEFTTQTDWLGRVASLTYPDGEVVSYTYNAMGQAKGMNGTVAGNLVTNIDYNDLGQVEEVALGNGALIENTYDAANRLETRSATLGINTFMNFSYDYDMGGNITQLIDSWLGETFTYEYDFLDRLTFVEGVTGAEDIIYSQEFNYDSIGNMMQLSNYIVPPPQPTPTVTPTSAPTDTPTPGDTPVPSDTPIPSDTPVPSDTPTPSSTPTQAPPTIDTYAYDANGNMIERVEAGVEWIQGFNAENRLTSLSSTEGTWTFTYDGNGNRVKQVHDGVVTLYLAGGAYEVRDATGDEEIYKYYGVAGQRLAMHSGGQAKYLLTDHLGSVVGVLSNAGTLMSEQRFLPFGEARFETGITETDFGFTGQRALAETGLMDYNARFYDARLGRFTQADTMGVSQNSPQSWNRYSYTANNPINRIDPSGHAWCEYEEVCDSSGGGYSSGDVTLGDVLAKGGLNGRNPDGSKNPVLRGRYCERRPEICQAQEEAAQQRQTNEQIADALTWGALVLDVVATEANALYAVAQYGIATFAPPSLPITLLAYQVYSFIPNAISALSWTAIQAAEVLRGNTKLTITDNGFSLRASQDSLAATASMVAGLLAREPIAATAIDSATVAYDIGRLPLTGTAPYRIPTFGSVSVGFNLSSGWSFSTIGP